MRLTLRMVGNLCESCIRPLIEFSTENGQKRAGSFVGTAHYTAPELLARTETGKPWVLERLQMLELMY